MDQGRKAKFATCAHSSQRRLWRANYLLRNDDLEVAENQLRQTLLAMLRQIQDQYPDSHVGQRWAPTRLGGTAPAPLN